MYRKSSIKHPPLPSQITPPFPRGEKVNKPPLF